MSSQNPLLLDTHIWVRYINGTPGLALTGLTAIEDGRKTGNVFISVITIWETALLVRKGRLHLPVSVEQWTAQALRLPGIRLTPFTPAIAIDSVALPDSLNRDPSDRILVATARIEKMRLMSRDKDILRFCKQTGIPAEKV